MKPVVMAAQQLGGLAHKRQSLEEISRAADEEQIPPEARGMVLAEGARAYLGQGLDGKTILILLSQPEEGAIRVGKVTSSPKGWENFRFVTYRRGVAPSQHEAEFHEEVFRCPYNSGRLAEALNGPQ